MSRATGWGVIAACSWGLVCGCAGTAADGGTGGTSGLGASGAAAAVSALFSGLAGSPNLATTGKTLDSSQTICNSLDAGPAKVLLFGYGGSDSRAYGARTAGITAGPDDFCLDVNQAALSGDASVGGYRFAAFTLLDTVAGDCSGGSLTMTQGSGIVRNTDDYMPEIYGRFEIDGVVTDCTLRIEADGTLDTANSACTDQNGLPVTITAGLSCTVSADLARIAIPTTIEGHYAVTTDEGLNVGYDCWVLYPTSGDAYGFTAITSDCTTFNNYGFNLASFNVGIIADANGQLFYTTDLYQLANRIKIIHDAGYPILFSVDLLYVAAYDGTPESVADGTDFPQTLIDDTTFIATLSAELYELAEWAERLNVELFAPLSEADRVFNTSLVTNAEATYLQTIRVDLEARFSGALVWIGQFYDSTDTATYNLAGFDYAGVNISPMPGHLSEAAFRTHLQTQLGNLRTVAQSFGLPYLITNAGIWGEALSNAYDWDASESRVVDTFTMMRDESTTYGTAGIIFWEGATGEVVFEAYPSLSRYIATQFGGTPSAF